MFDRLLRQAFSKFMEGAKGTEAMRATHEEYRPLGHGQLTITILLSGLLLITSIAGSGAEDTTLKVSPDSYDFGPVVRLGGEVHTSFMVYVQGDAPIKIRRIWTS
jgi:hypothetical protein